VSRLSPLPAALALAAAACASSGAPSAAAATAATAPVATTRVTTTTGANVSVSAINNPTASVRWINATPANVWTAVQAVYADLKIPITEIDAPHMALRNTGLKVRRTLAGERMPRWLSCGGSNSMPNAETYEIHATISTQVVPGKDGNGSDIVTLFEAIASPVQFSGAPVACASTQELERRIYTLVGQKLST
jgi:hypothetical protein